MNGPGSCKQVQLDKIHVDEIIIWQYAISLLVKKKAQTATTPPPPQHLILTFFLSYEPRR